MGFLRPFAGLLPTFGWTRHVCFTVTRASGAHRCARRADISARPGPRVVRASASAPIDFRRGDRSPVGNHTDLRKSDRPGMLMASTSGLRFPSAVHLASARLAGGVILPWALPLAGLSGTQTISTMVAVHRPGSTPLPITSLRNIHAPLIAGARSFLSAHGLARRPSHHPRPLRLRGAAPRHRADVFACDCEVLSLRAFVVALQRLDGADALPT
jgi:hypothetical protein